MFMTGGVNEFGGGQADNTRGRDLESSRMLVDPAALPRAGASSPH